MSGQFVDIDQRIDLSYHLFGLLPCMSENARLKATLLHAAALPFAILWATKIQPSVFPTVLQLIAYYFCLMNIYFFHKSFNAVVMIQRQKGRGGDPRSASSIDSHCLNLIKNISIDKLVGLR